MALADCKGNVAVFRHDKDGYTLRAKLPRFASVPTALAFGPAHTVLVVYSNNKVGCNLSNVVFSDSRESHLQVYEYDLDQGKSTGLSAALDECPAWKGCQHLCSTVTFDSCNNVFLHDDSNVIVIKRNVNCEGFLHDTTNLKARKISKNIKSEPKVDVCFIPKYKVNFFCLIFRKF